MTNFVLLIYSLQKFSFISLSMILLYYKIPRYLYPFFSTSLILHQHASLLLQMTLLSLFSVQVHQTFLFHSIPISLLNICTVETNPFISSSLFAKIFKSSINKRWFYFSPFFKVYPDFSFLNIWVRGIIRITNSNGDKLSP